MKRINPRHPKRTQMDHWQNLPEKRRAAGA
jgi:hypothetical protein